MLARCTVCQSTFVAPQFGEQSCPKCGARVFIEDPRVVVARPVEPVPEEAAPPAEPVPWERRKELGLVRAFTSTLVELTLRPTRFFEGASYKTDSGAVLYLTLVYLVPAMVAAAVSAALASGDAETQKTLDMLHQLQPNIPADVKPLVDMVMSESQQGLSVGSLLREMLNAALIYAGLFGLSAASAHGLLMLLGAAKGGWMATFKVFVYSMTPALFLLVPNVYWLWYVGAIGALLWSAALEIIGLAKAHKTTQTYATVAIVAPELVCFTCVAAVAFTFLLKLTSLSP
jgi:hypothetical protein